MLLTRLGLLGLLGKVRHRADPRRIGGAAEAGMRCARGALRVAGARAKNSSHCGTPACAVQGHLCARAGLSGQLARRLARCRDPDP
jgi:hypothetical protein